MEKEFKKAYEELRVKHLEEDEELEKELKRSGRYENGLDGNAEEFRKLHQKHWEEIKNLCNKYGVKYEDKK